MLTCYSKSLLAQMTLRLLRHPYLFLMPLHINPINLTWETDRKVCIES